VDSPSVSILLLPPPPSPPPFPYTPLFRSGIGGGIAGSPPPARGARKQSAWPAVSRRITPACAGSTPKHLRVTDIQRITPACAGRSEEHTSELQSRENLVCRLLLEKKK